jgi:cystinosin
MFIGCFINHHRWHSIPSIVLDRIHTQRSVKTQMDTFHGFSYSWSGFVDYSGCYHRLAPFWTLLGSFVFVGTGLSVVPQLVRITKLRTSAGLSCLFVAITSMGQVLIVVNMFCLHNADFYGILQITAKLVIPRFLSFATAFILWFAYLPVVFMTFVFAPVSLTVREWRMNLVLSGVVVVISWIMLVPYFVVGTNRGFGAPVVAQLGKICGIVSTVVTVCQYLPQFVTVCKLKDNGSLSLLTLAIQAPGGTISTVFMAFGNREDWSTWVALGIAALQQWFLLGLCLIYKARQAALKSKADPALLMSVSSEAYT